ncbi:MAG TPA: hypothetical protein VIY08_07560 [Candidatus Nitrosocosmicus sp.]
MGALNRRFQEKYMLIQQHLQKRMRLSKIGQSDTCGYKIPKERL